MEYLSESYDPGSDSEKIELYDKLEANLDEFVDMLSMVQENIRKLPNNDLDLTYEFYTRLAKVLNASASDVAELSYPV